MYTLGRTALNPGDLSAPPALLHRDRGTSAGRAEARNPTVEEILPGSVREGPGAMLACGLVCLIVIAAIWAYALGQIRDERAQAVASAFAENTNLVAAFADQAKSVLSSVERTLQKVSDGYVRGGVRLNARDLNDGGLIDNGTLNFVGVMDEQAKTLAGGPGIRTVDAVEREVYEFHRQHAQSAPHLGKPVPGPLPDTWLLPLSQRIDKPDGAFGGVAYALLDPDGFTHMFRHVSIGRQGLAVLAGFDGIARAGNFGRMRGAGNDVSAGSLVAEQVKHAAGNFSSADGFDEVPRWMTYRTLAEYSLIAAVGTAQADRLAPLAARERNYYSAAALATGFVLLCCAGFMYTLATRRRGIAAIHSGAARYGAAFGQAVVGVVRTGLDGRILDVNGALCGMLGYAREELLQCEYAEIAHADCRQLAADTMQRLAAGQNGSESPPMEQCLVRKGGAPVWVTAALTLVRDTDGNPECCMLVIEDVTERKRAELSRQARGSFIDILVRSTNETELAQKMCDHIVNINGYVLAWIGSVEHDRHKTVRPIAYAGYPAGFMENAQITWADNVNGSGPAGTAVRTRTARAVQNACADPAFEPWQGNAARLGYASVVSLPLLSFDNVLGVLTIYSPVVDAFQAADMHLLNELAADLAFCLATLRARSAREKAEQRRLRGLEQTLLAMAETVETRDAGAAGRHRRVAGLATAIAREIGMPEEEIHALHLAAVMQDVGEIRIPPGILTKPARLTGNEYELVKSHPGDGYDILKGVDSPWPIAQMVYQHHERLDGSGYPQGLKDAQILPGAKILAVADTVEAMASDRPHRPGCGIEKALAEIIDFRATRYDTAAVNACVKLFRQQQYAFAA